MTKRLPSEVVRDFGNLPWSHQDAREYAARKGGRVHFDPETKSWLVIIEKRPRRISVEDDCWT